MREKELMDATRVALQRLSCRLFRNNNGLAHHVDSKTGRRRVVRYGLGDGTGDLIGWQTVEITPEMVGQKIARFVSAEAKQGSGKETPAQRAFRWAVNDAGGLAIVFETPEQALALLSSGGPSEPSPAR